MCTNQQIMGGRGSNFTPEEVFALAKAWVYVSKQVDEQNADTFWSSVASKYAELPEAEPMVHRSANSLRCQWTTVQRSAQKYLAADSLYRANIPSGEIEEDTKANVMELYRQKNRVKNRKGELKPAPPIKYLPAVWLLSKEPKFSQKYSGSSEENNGYRGALGSRTSRNGMRSREMSQDEVCPDLSGTELEDETGEGLERQSPDVVDGANGRPKSSARPIGVKKRKYSERKENALSRAIDSFASLLKKSSAQRSKTFALTLKVKIVQMMEDGPEKQAALLALMQRADDLESSS